MLQPACCQVLHHRYATPVSDSPSDLFKARASGSLVNLDMKHQDRTA